MVDMEIKKTICHGMLRDDIKKSVSISRCRILEDMIDNVRDGRLSRSFE